MNTHAQHPTARLTLPFLAMILIAGQTAFGQKPVIVEVYGTTTSDSLVTVDAGIEARGVPGYVRFILYPDPAGHGVYRSTPQAFPADSGAVFEFSDVFDLPGLSGGFLFKASVATAFDTVEGRWQHLTFDAPATTPDVGNVAAETIGTTTMKISASCNPRGQSVTFKFSWSSDPWVYFKYSEPVILPPIDHDTVLSWVVAALVPGIPYYFDAKAVAVERHEVWGSSPEQIGIRTLDDSTARGLTVPIIFHFVNGEFGEITQPKNLGVHSNATECYDYPLGEDDLAPAPPAPTIDIRFVDPDAGVVRCFNDGSYNDIRQFRDSNQVDTFYIRILNAWNYLPILVSWTDLSGLYAGPVTLRSPIDSIDMLVTNHYDLVHPAITFLTITAAGPRPRAHAPNLIIDEMGAVEATTAILQGTVNPNGLPTEAWFEWGESEAYGRKTPTEELGGSFTAVSHSAEVTELVSGLTYHYRIVVANSVDTLRGPDQVFATAALTGAGTEPGAPAGFRLYQNFPNPFNPATEVRYSIPSRAQVTLVVYDALGREVARLVDAVRPPGEHTARWDAADLPGGAYFCRIVTSDGFSRVIPMLLLR